MSTLERRVPYGPLVEKVFEPTHVITFHSTLNKSDHRTLMVIADDDRHAWQQAEWRLGSLDTVVSVKPYKE